jgi:lipoprotein-releasing system ATP-binding protein
VSEDSLKLLDVSMTFALGETTVNVLHDVNLSVRRGESVALVGESGIGKSTLLQISALLERPTSGDVLINGIMTRSLNNLEKTRIRSSNIGFVYQSHNLLPEFSALENVAIPQFIRGAPRGSAFGRAIELLKAVGLSDRLHHRPQMLSGGERQRVAIARALANAPKIIIADEPTGSLDPKTSFAIFSLLLDLVETGGISMLMATHNLELAERLDTVLHMGATGISRYSTFTT